MLSDNEKLKKWEPLVYKISNKHLGAAKKCSLELEDLVSVGNMAIITAYNTHDPEKSKIITHVYNHINWAIKSEITQSQNIKSYEVLKICRLNNIKKTSKIELSNSDILKLDKKMYPKSSYFRSTDDVESIKGLSKIKIQDYNITNHTSVSIDESSRLESRAIIRDIISYIENVKPKDKSILTNRWLNQKTLKETAKSCNISFQYVRQVEATHKKILAKKFDLDSGF